MEADSVENILATGKLLGIIGISNASMAPIRTLLQQGVAQGRGSHDFASLVELLQVPVPQHDGLPATHS